MKRISVLLFSSALLLSSCHTLTKTARITEVGNSLQSATVVDLTPATDQRITHTIEPGKDIRRGGMANIRQAVEAEALTKYGNADVLLEPQYVVSKRWTLFGPKVTSISVSGRPAYYTNFRALDDSVWCNPVFRGVNMHQRALPLASKKTPVKKNVDDYIPVYRTRGWTMYLTPFVGYGTFECDHADADGTAFAAFLSLGYQLNPYLYFGVGTGVNGMDGEFNDWWGGHTDLRGTYIPLFANARVNFSKKRNTLFVDGKIGGSIAGDTGAVGNGDGFFWTMSLGYSFGNFDIAFQGVSHWRDYEYYIDYWESDLDPIHFFQMGVSIGFRF